MEIPDEWIREKWGKPGGRVDVKRHLFTNKNTGDFESVFVLVPEVIDQVLDAYCRHKNVTEEIKKKRVRVQFALLSRFCADFDETDTAWADWINAQSTSEN